MSEIGSAAAARRLNGIDITFDNRGDRLIGLGFVNGLLKVLSLGLYSFWGKTEVRKRLWSFTKLNGEPLEYTGTGKELFVGFLVVFFGVFLPVIIASVAVRLIFPQSPNAIAIFYIGLYVLFFYLIGYAMYRAQRYRLSRTQWRGIRGALSGSPGRYGWTYFWTIALPALAALAIAAVFVNAEALDLVKLAGPAALFPAMMSSPISVAALVAGIAVIALILPWRSNTLQNRITRDMAFGNVELKYTGSAKPLYRNYLLAALGSIVLLAAAVAVTGALVGAGQAAEAAGDLTMGEVATGTKLTIAAVWIVFFIALAVITAWYRANQVNHFARHTHFGEASFRAEATGPGLVWLALSNWLIVVVLTLLGYAVGAAVAFSIGAFPTAGIAGAGGNYQPSAGTSLALMASILLPLVLMTSIGTTFAQLRSARYFLSRLKLDGAVDLDAVHQSANLGPRHGEGLAQAFDLDAF